jgi:hypothetical protein
MERIVQYGFSLYMQNFMDKFLMKLVFLVFSLISILHYKILQVKIYSNQPLNCSSVHQFHNILKMWDVIHI